MMRSRSSSSISPVRSESRRSQKGIPPRSPACAAFACASRYARSAASTARSSAPPSAVRLAAKVASMMTLFGAGSGALPPKSRPRNDMSASLRRAEKPSGCPRNGLHPWRDTVAPVAGTNALLQWTGDVEADRLISEDPTALLIGFCLDQQVPIEWAFMGPLRLRERLGTLDPERIARMDPAQVEAAFRTPPALHRFPRSMAQRVQGLCTVIADEYGGDASRIWRDVQDGRELQRRFAALPGFGAAKARIMVGVVAKHFGARPAGWETIAPDWPTLADVNTVEEREAYQTQKRAHKAAVRAAADTGAPRGRR